MAELMVFLQMPISSPSSFFTFSAALELSSMPFTKSHFSAYTKVDRILKTSCCLIVSCCLPSPSFFAYAQIV